jgi:hypothetical protein
MYGLRSISLRLLFGIVIVYTLYLLSQINTFSKKINEFYSANIKNILKLPAIGQLSFLLGLIIYKKATLSSNPQRAFIDYWIDGL